MPQSLRSFAWIALAGFSLSSRAGDFEQARQMWNLVNGGSLLRESEPQAAAMMQALRAGRPLDAADLAIRDPRSTFASIQVRQMFLPMTSPTGADPGQPVGDFVLTAMASALEDHPFTSWFTENRVYSADASGNYGYSNSITNIARFNGQFDNDGSLRALIEGGRFYKTPQNYLAPDAAAGLLTTQQYGKVAFESGTNRRMIRKTFEDFLCLDLKNMMNFGFLDSWIGRDVDRAPGGQPQTFQNTCRGCHAGMDGLRGAFAYLDFSNEKIRYTPGTVARKYSNNAATFPEGYVTVTDAWVDFWGLGDASHREGQGPQDFARLLTTSPYLASCFVKRVSHQMCPGRAWKPGLEARLAERFRKSDSLLALFKDVAVGHCMGLETE